MKAKIILSAGILSILALLIISNGGIVYSQNDPGCENCTKASCDKTCIDKGACDEKEKTDCKDDAKTELTSSGATVNTDIKTSDICPYCGKDCSKDCSGLPCDKMNSKMKK